jgi:hypothetical protein
VPRRRSRTTRSSAPPGTALAARFDEAEVHGLAELYRNCADFFPALRLALNRVADRHLFPVTGDRIDRLLRQVADSFGQKQG